MSKIVWDGKEWITIPELVVTWDSKGYANRWKHLCKIIGHKWQPSHPHMTICDRCGMAGWEHYKTLEES